MVNFISLSMLLKQQNHISTEFITQFKKKSLVGIKNVIIRSRETSSQVFILVRIIFVQLVASLSPVTLKKIKIGIK